MIDLVLQLHKIAPSPSVILTGLTIVVVSCIAYDVYTKIKD